MFVMKEVGDEGGWSILPLNKRNIKCIAVLLCIAGGHLLDLATVQVTQLHSGAVRINVRSLAWPENHGDIMVTETRQQQVCQDRSWLSPSTYLYTVF